ncbi:hypothetical protein [Bartonella jaculi]|uniref:Uncharacterized protein n=1 Tax=Bartonella jaculi TaxID=686226 RepID=A0ABP9NBD6_9HYPH
MKIRYFFIVGAVTSGLALAFEASDHIVNQQQGPIISPYTSSEKDLNLIEPASGTFSLSFIPVNGDNNNSNTNNGNNNTNNGNNNTKPKVDISNLYKQGTEILYAVGGFLCSSIMIGIEALVTNYLNRTA